MWNSLKKSFIAGILVILPLGVTLIVINFLITNVGQPASKFMFFWLDDTIRNQQVFEFILSAIAILLLALGVTFLGIFSRYLLGKFIIGTTEWVFEKMPFINTIYKSVKQIVATFSLEGKAVFQETVLIEYPRKGTYAIGFLTSRGKGEVQAKTGGDVVNVFVPTTPNPTSGFLLMVPVEDIISLEMPVGDAMKAIISGGAVVPPYPPPPKVTNREGGEKEKRNLPFRLTSPQRGGNG
jgi:uncharacterized membrane protein